MKKIFFRTIFPFIIFGILIINGCNQPQTIRPKEIMPSSTLTDCVNSTPIPKSLNDIFDVLDYDWKTYTEGYLRILKTLINDSLWYQGVASPAQVLIGGSYFVCAENHYSAGDSELNFLLGEYSTSEESEEIFCNFWAIKARSYYSPIYKIETIKYLEDDEIEYGEQKYNFDDYYSHNYNFEEYKLQPDGAPLFLYSSHGIIKIESPVKPEYFDCEAKQFEMQIIQEKAIAAVQAAGFPGKCRIFVRDFFNKEYKDNQPNPGEHWFNNETDVFIETENGNILQARYSARYGGMDIAEEYSELIINNIIYEEKEEEWYYYQQVKNTTNLIFDIIVKEKTGK